jgi:hypothetical protein
VLIQVHPWLISLGGGYAAPASVVNPSPSKRHSHAVKTILSVPEPISSTFLSLTIGMTGYILNKDRTNAGIYRRIVAQRAQPAEPPGHNVNK